MTAALLTNTSTGPHRSRISCKAELSCGLLVTSAGKAAASPLRSFTSFAVSSTSSTEPANTATRAPAAPSPSAIARPIPRPLPVTNATRSRSAALLVSLAVLTSLLATRGGAVLPVINWIPQLGMLCGTRGVPPDDPPCSPPIPSVQPVTPS